ncbi:hypothetical protein [Jannaschia pohangensis]|uniref:Uncharacterized protein n=1 Tax=Jannaschia pohangensis TaxID=390807 RepID=A0A1I3QYM2_9RHOB|nr:hypothetical protein [Jannaschia pohangensis]SFJ38995.1 hypothetical protein SAMN04488095_2717 [Jannaschia pohangensis]
MSRSVLILGTGVLPLLLAGCIGGGETGTSQALATGDGVAPGHASCLAAIGRPDVAMDPEAELTKTEITEFLACISERAGG